MQHKDQLDEDSQRRLSTNPMRILDSKNPSMQELIANAPQLLNYLDEESKSHFSQLQGYLTNAGLSYTINPCLVRGLDYYTKTVFEWVTTELGAQGAVCSGGRYDGLVEQLGGKATPALGFAIGMERLVLLTQHVRSNPIPNPLHVYFMTDGNAAFQIGLRLADELRDNIPGLRLWLHCGGGNLKNQFKKADKSGALFALILGENELQQHSISIKSLREQTPQVTVKQTEAIEYLTRIFHT